MGRHRRAARPEESLVLAAAPDWRTDPRLRWTPRDQIRWALWVSQFPQEDLGSDIPYRGSGRELQHHQHDRRFRDERDRLAIGTKDDLWQDLRFEVALFALAASCAAPQFIRREGWRLMPMYNIVRAGDTDCFIPTIRSEIHLAKWNQEIQEIRGEFHSGMLYATEWDLDPMPTWREALAAVKALAQLLKRFDSREEIAGHVLHTPDPKATTQCGSPVPWAALVEQRFLTLATQFRARMHRCEARKSSRRQGKVGTSASRCARILLREHKGQRFCSETCQEREDKREQRRPTRAPSAQSRNSQRKRKPQTPGRK